MRQDLRERRLETWDLLVIKGIPYGDVVTRLADKYGTAESTIESDIGRMDNWFPKLDLTDDELVRAQMRLREHRQNRQEIQQLILRIRNNDNISDATKIKRELEARRQLDESVEREVQLAQSLGFLDRAPDQISVSGDVSHDHDHAHTHTAELGDDLSERQREHLDSITTGPEEITVEAVPEAESEGSE